LGAADVEDLTVGAEDAGDQLGITGEAPDGGGGESRTVGGDALFRQSGADEERDPVARTPDL